MLVQILLLLALGSSLTPAFAQVEAVLPPGLTMRVEQSISNENCPALPPKGKNLKYSGEMTLNDGVLSCGENPRSLGSVACEITLGLFGLDTDEPVAIGVGQECKILEFLDSDTSLIAYFGLDCPIISISCTAMRSWRLGQSVPTESQIRYNLAPYITLR